MRSKATAILLMGSMSLNAGGHRFKIEVSAITGEIIQGYVEDWAIGRKPDA